MSNQHLKMVRIVGTLVVLSFIRLPALGEDARTDLDIGILAEIIGQLDSDSFPDRMEAQRRLEELTQSQLQKLEHIALTHLSAEVAVRIVDALEYHYVSDDLESARSASLALESLLESNRGLVRESAANVLTNHWVRRTLLVVEILRKRGALFILPPGFGRDGDSRQHVVVRPRAFPGFPTDEDLIQVFITDEWTGSRGDLAALRRMPAIQEMNGPAARAVNPRPGFMLPPRQRAINYPKLGVFLVNGHPLSDEDATWLRAVIGDTRISDRGQVMLGIRSQWGGTGTGCRIGAVVAAGSAHLSGLMAGDLITAVEGQQIESFDDLVDDLRRFNVGDTVQVRVQRRIGLDLDVDVKLRSWKDWVRSVSGNGQPSAAESE